MTDYIAREAALDAIDCGNLHRGIVDALRANLNEVPAAPVSRVRHGRWRWDVNGMDWNIGAWVCSACGVRPETWWCAQEDVKPHRCSGSRYCPNCGAKMKGDEYELLDQR